MYPTGVVFLLMNLMGHHVLGGSPWKDSVGPNPQVTDSCKISELQEIGILLWYLHSPRRLAAGLDL